MNRNWQNIRNDFPILKEKIHNKPLIYLDNAATTQMPQPVIDSWMEHYTRFNGNVHRGIHYLSEMSTQHMENTRVKVLSLLHGNKEGQVVFTSGATDSANLVACSFLRHRLAPGDVVVTTELEHHSNYVIWQQLCRECGAQFKVIPSIDGDIDMDAACRMINDKCRFLAVTSVSNVVGTVVDLKPLIQLAHSFNIPVYIDAAQAIRHTDLNFKELNYDFLGFSAHKMMGPTGVGCLFIRDKYLDSMKPYRYGGGMVDIVSENDSTFPALPARLEAGTPNYSGIIAFGSAIDYLTDIGLENIYDREKALTSLMEKLLRDIPRVHILGNPKHRAGVISFIADGVHPYDLASFLDKYGVALRTGSMCAQPIVNKYGVKTITRISPAFYNTIDELNSAAKYINQVIDFLSEQKKRKA